MSLTVTWNWKSLKYRGVYAIFACIYQPGYIFSSFQCQLSIVILTWNCHAQFSWRLQTTRQREKISPKELKKFRFANKQASKLLEKKCVYAADVDDIVVVACCCCCCIDPMGKLYLLLDRVDATDNDGHIQSIPHILYIHFHFRATLKYLLRCNLNHLLVVDDFHHNFWCQMQIFLQFETVLLFSVFFPVNSYEFFPHSYVLFVYLDTPQW